MWKQSVHTKKGNSSTRRSHLKATTTINEQDVLVLDYARQRAIAAQQQEVHDPQDDQDRDDQEDCRHVVDTSIGSTRFTCACGRKARARHTQSTERTLAESSASRVEASQTVSLDEAPHEEGLGGARRMPVARTSLCGGRVDGWGV